MAEVLSEGSNMDNLPTPPRIAGTERPSPAVHMDGRGSPHSIEEEAAGHGRMVTPARDLKTAGSGRSSSPRPKSASPSEYLLKTTAARVSDGHELERRRSTIIVQEEEKKKVGKKLAAAPPPSERLLKTTVARISDVNAWHQTKGVIKHEEDIWWEQRKPLENASKANAAFNVESRLLEPTTSHIYSQRKKFPPRTTPDKNAVPGSAEKSPLGASPLHVSKINTESPLLRPTFNSQVKNVKNQPVPPPPPVMELPSHNTGPRNVPSRLFAATTSTRSAKWKSKEELSAEEAELARQKAAAKKVKAPSEHLISYNTRMKYGARPKVTKVEGDQRELGWNSSFKKDHIPPVEEVPPLPGQRLGASPPRRRSDGGGNSRGEFSRSLNSSLESVEQHQQAGENAVQQASPFNGNGSLPAKAWQEEGEGEQEYHNGNGAHDHEHDGSMDYEHEAAEGLNGELAGSQLMDGQHHEGEGEGMEQGEFESY